MFRKLRLLMYVMYGCGFFAFLLILFQQVFKKKLVTDEHYLLVWIVAFSALAIGALLGDWIQKQKNMRLVRFLKETVPVGTISYHYDKGLTKETLGQSGLVGLPPSSYLSQNLLTWKYQQSQFQMASVEAGKRVHYKEETIFSGTVIQIGQNAEREPYFVAVPAEYAGSKKIVNEIHMKYLRKIFQMESKSVIPDYIVFSNQKVSDSQNTANLLAALNRIFLEGSILMTGFRNGSYIGLWDIHLFSGDDNEESQNQLTEVAEILIHL